MERDPGEPGQPPNAGKLIRKEVLGNRTYQVGKVDDTWLLIEESTTSTWFFSRERDLETALHLAREVLLRLSKSR